MMHIHLYNLRSLCHANSGQIHWTPCQVFDASSHSILTIKIFRQAQKKTVDYVQTSGSLTQHWHSQEKRSIRLHSLFLQK